MIYLRHILQSLDDYDEITTLPWSFIFDKRRDAWEGPPVEEEVEKR